MTMPHGFRKMFRINIRYAHYIFALTSCYTSFASTLLILEIYAQVGHINGSIYYENNILFRIIVSTFQTVHSSRYHSSRFEKLSCFKTKLQFATTRNDNHLLWVNCSFTSRDVKSLSLI